jgi:hypothetical protein
MPIGGEYSITDDGRVRPKHVLIEFKKWMCYIDGQKNKYSSKQTRLCGLVVRVPGLAEQELLEESIL